MSFDELKNTYYLYKRVYSFSSLTCAILALKWFLFNSSPYGVSMIALLLILCWVIFFGISWSI